MQPAFFRRVAMMEEKVEKAEGGFFMRAMVALVPSAISAIAVAFATIQITKAEVSRLIDNDKSQASELSVHAKELAILNERMVNALNQLKDIAASQGSRLERLEGRVMDVERNDRRVRR